MPLSALLCITLIYGDWEKDYRCLHQSLSTQWCPLQSHTWRTICWVGFPFFYRKSSVVLLYGHLLHWRQTEVAVSASQRGTPASFAVVKPGTWYHTSGAMQKSEEATKPTAEAEPTSVSCGNRLLLGPRLAMAKPPDQHRGKRTKDILLRMTWKFSSHCNAILREIHADIEKLLWRGSRTKISLIKIRPFLVDTQVTRA